MSSIQIAIVIFSKFYILFLYLFYSPPSNKYGISLCDVSHGTEASPPVSNSIRLVRTGLMLFLYFSKLVW